MKNLLTTIVIIIVILSLASCTKDKNGSTDYPEVIEVPFTGDWTAAEDPIYLHLKSETGKIEIPILGEINDAKAAATIKNLIAREIDFKDSYLFVTQLKSDQYNVRLEAMIGAEQIVKEAHYENDVITIEFNPEDFSTKTSQEEVRVSVFQETPEDLRLYLDKTEIMRLVQSGIIQFSPQTKVEFDINALLEQIQELEFGINLKKDE